MFINSHFTALFFSAVVDNILFFLCGFFLVFKLFGGGNRRRKAVSWSLDSHIKRGEINININIIAADWFC